MLSNSECAVIAARKTQEIFGREYLLNNREHMCSALGEKIDNKYMAFLGIKTKDDCPHMQPNKQGWTVFAEVYVDKVTGEVTVADYQTEVAS